MRVLSLHNFAKFRCFISINGKIINSRGSIAFIGVCLCVGVSVCLSVCLSVRTVEPNRLKLQSHNLPQGQSITSPGYPFNNTCRSKGQRLKGQRFKGRGHRVTKCKNIFQTIEWPVHLRTFFQLLGLVRPTTTRLKYLQ